MVRRNLALISAAAAALAAMAPSQVRPASDARADEPLLSAWQTLEAHQRLVRCLAFAPTGALATGGQDRLICLWSAEGELLHRIDLWPGGG